VDLRELDHHGRPVTSCIIDRDRRTREDRDAEQQATRATAKAAADHEADLTVLRIVHAHPDATSQRAIRDYAGLKANVINTAVARLLTQGWMTRPDKKQQPYRVTEAGHTALRQK
jgi:hypothetical protein